MPLIHLEHPEDTVLTGNLTALQSLRSGGYLSAKIDGSPALVWGTDPNDKMFFIGTKSVFNKRIQKMCKSYSDVKKYYKESLHEILTQCFRYLPNDGNIYQGDFIGFGGTEEYQPNTITYKFSDVILENIIIAPHTIYKGSSKDIRELTPTPLTHNLKDTLYTKFVKPEVVNNNCQDDLDTMINFAETIAGAVEFIEDPKDAAKLCKELNSYIREGREIVPEQFDNINLIRFWKLVLQIKEDFIMECDINHTQSDPQSYLFGNKHMGEGYVLNNEFGMLKLINRRSFSYANFNNPKFA